LHKSLLKNWKVERLIQFLQKKFMKNLSFNVQDRVFKEAYEEFKKLDKPIQKLIKAKLDILAKNPDALKRNIKPLKGFYAGLPPCC